MSSLFRTLSKGIPSPLFKCPPSEHIGGGGSRAGGQQRGEMARLILYTAAAGTAVAVSAIAYRAHQRYSCSPLRCACSMQRASPPPSGTLTLSSCARALPLCVSPERHPRCPPHHAVRVAMPVFFARAWNLVSGRRRRAGVKIFLRLFFTLRRTHALILL